MSTSLRTWLAAFLAASLLAVAGCAPSPVSPPVPPKPTVYEDTAAVLRLAQQRLDKGQYPEAADAFQAALKMRAAPDQVSQARLGLAQALAGYGETEQALSQLRELLSEGGLPNYRLEALIWSARLEMRLGRLGDAEARLRGLLVNPPLTLSPEEERQVVAMLAEAQENLGQNGQATATLLRLAGLSRPDQTLALAKRLAVTAGKAPSAQIEPLWSTASTPLLRAALALGLAQGRLREGKLAQAQAGLMELRQQAAAQPLLPQIEALGQELTQAQSVELKAVGVLLPLSGNYETPGRHVLSAVELGLGVFSSGEQGPTLFIEDSGTDPKIASEAVARLVNDHKVVAIIGTLDGASAPAAARQAQAMQVPMISLSVVDGLTRTGDYVFQNFFTAGDQVEALLGEAMDKRGIKRVAVLAPRNAYGQGFVKLFDAGVLARGGQVVRSVYYDPNQTDFSNDIRQVAGLAPAGGQPADRGAGLDFEALFIPDSAERVGLILPQLAYNDVTGVTLLGTSLWHKPKLLELAGHFLQAAIIPDAFDPQSESPLVSSFVSEFKQGMGLEPNVLEAHGYDAGLLVRHLLTQPNPPRTRQAMRDALAQAQGVQGVCGLLSVNAERRVIKPLPLFTVRGEAFKRLDLPDSPVEPTVLPPPAPSGQPLPPATPSTYPR